MSLNNPVRSLNPEVARKIAAGEVIDRPNAIVRELLDNAIDSGATAITVEINGGGIEKIRVMDNGCGMTKEDLQNCARPHATSKISTEVDLMNLSTLGFRGEALASVAAVARLSIISGGWKMRASLTEDHLLEPYTEIKGTIVQSEGLFENFPARRQFLKRPATEGLMCKNTFIEKAMSNPSIAFKLIIDGETKLDLPSDQSLKDRFIFANSILESQTLFYEVSAKSSSKDSEFGPDWSFAAVIGEPAISRSSKKDIFIFANNRRIQEYSLVQAVEYGGQGFFPNGTYPVAAVFIKINPKLVDFNIHPAKKEARFYDISDLHHGVSSNLRNFFQQYTRKNFDEDRPADDVRADFQPTFFDEEKTSGSGFSKSTYSSATDSTKASGNFSNYQKNNNSDYERHLSYKNSETAAESLSDFRSKYFGIKKSSENSDFVSAQNTPSSGIPSFDELQTAGSHSTPSFDQLQTVGSQTPSEATKTLGLAEQAMASFHPEILKEESEKNRVKFLGSTLGTFLLAEKNNCLYIVDQHAAHERILFDKIMNSQGKRQELLIPYKIKTDSKSQDNQLEKLQSRLTEIGFETKQIESGYWEISSIPQRWTGTEYDLRTLIFVKQVEPEQIIRSIAAMTACHAAVKDGYVLDDQTAGRLVEQAFLLEDPHCPHGRPIYTVFSRQKLFELVKRT